MRSRHAFRKSWMRALDGQFLYLSPAFEQIWGIQRSQMTPEYWLNALHPEDKPRSASVEKVRSGREYEGEFRIVRPDGEVRYIKNRGYPIFESGELVRFGGVARDVTEEMRMQASSGSRRSSKRSGSSRGHRARDQHAGAVRRRQRHVPRRWLPRPTARDSRVQRGARAERYRPGRRRAPARAHEIHRRRLSARRDPARAGSGGRRHAADLEDRARDERVLAPRRRHERRPISITSSPTRDRCAQRLEVRAE